MEQWIVLETITLSIVSHQKMKQIIKELLYILLQIGENPSFASLKFSKKELKMENIDDGSS